MRTIALSLIAATLVFAAEVDTPYTRIAKLATYISAGDATSALEVFDKSLKNYGKISEDLNALSTQTDVLCSIDVVEDKEADNTAADIHHLDLDWFVTLTSKADSSQTQARRMRIAVTIQRSGTKWRITSLTPDNILAPITIK